MDAGERELSDGPKFQVRVQRQRLLATDLRLPKEIRNFSPSRRWHLLLLLVQSPRPHRRQPTTSPPVTLNHSLKVKTRKSRLHLPHKTRSPPQIAKCLQKNRISPLAIKIVTTLPDPKDNVQCQQLVTLLLNALQLILLRSLRHPRI